MRFICALIQNSVKQISDIQSQKSALTRDRPNLAKSVETKMRRSRRFSQVNEEIKTVLITGANGFIASHIIELLLTTTNYNVRASVRNIQDTSKVAHLVTFPNARRRLRLFEADILEQGSFDNAMKDVQVVFHVAAPYFLTSDDPYRDLVEPLETGTFNVLTSATKSERVHTIVLTSSMRAIADRPREKEFTEDDWNNDSNLKRNPYFYSKLKAERSAWDFYERSTKLMGVAPFRLVTINPAMVIVSTHKYAYMYRPLNAIRCVGELCTYPYFLCLQ